MSANNTDVDLQPSVPWKTKQWQEKRAAFLADKIACVYCGRITKKLIVHHHTYTKEEPEYWSFIDCVVVCSKCHYGLYKGYTKCKECNRNYQITGQPKPAGRYCEFGLRFLDYPRPSCHYSKEPSRKGMDRSEQGRCAMECKACNGPVQKCPNCGVNYCPHHFICHRRHG